jgi:branched-chain amino acid transport system ATP-binding protein
MSLFEIRNLSISYHKIKAVKGISLSINEGEIISLIGANGAGKTSILNAISGIIPYSGEISYIGKMLNDFPAHEIVTLGIAHVPEGRGIFGNLTILENLKIAASTQKGKISFDRVFNLFPRLKERQNQLGGTLSGGEQQMLSVGRALMSKPKLLLLDEPSMGLSPVMVDEIFSLIKKINEEGTTILLVEQNASRALQIASHGYVLETGNIVLEGSGQFLLNNPRVKEAYLGS